MSYLNKPVAYLQDSDLDDKGDLINPKIPKNIPVIIMLQGDFCGYCTKAKPAFQELADENENKIFCATIQADGKEKGENELGKRLNKIYSNFQGFPHYVGYKNGKFIKDHNGGRDKDSLKKFAMSL
jgi:thiol-disulfide isomerase/thioredoxin